MAILIIFPVILVQSPDRHQCHNVVYWREGAGAEPKSGVAAALSVPHSHSKTATALPSPAAAF